MQEQNEPTTITTHEEYLVVRRTYGELIARADEARAKHDYQTAGELSRQMIPLENALNDYEGER